VTQVWHVEVNQEAQFEMTDFQVGHELCDVHRQEFFNAFNFDDQTLLDDEINAVGSRQRDVSVDNRKSHLVLDMQAGLVEFVKQTGTNRALQHPRRECTMNLHGCYDHCVTRGIWPKSLCVLCVHCGVRFKTRALRVSAFGTQQPSQA
jgi:hypothetical protein